MSEEPTPRGRLKVFLGYAAGVGKTYQMLTEAHELRRRGVDVVIGYVEPHERPDVLALAKGLEVVPRRAVVHGGESVEEMDAPAILRRHPRVAVVDELPHTNAPGLPTARRWEDVDLLLDAGIDVLTTMNVQHLESLNDEIWQSTGVRVCETIPDWVVKRADEVVMVDLTPRALLNRLERGVVYPPDGAQAALDSFFKEPTLVALREFAMRQAAHAMESRLADEEASPPASDAAEPAPRERLLLLVGPDPASAALIRRGRRMADYLRADCLAVYVSTQAGLGELTKAEREALERHFNFARGLLIEARILDGTDVAQALVDFARGNEVTQIFVTRDGRSATRSFLRQPLAQRIVARARDMQVTIVADRSARH